MKFLYVGSAPDSDDAVDRIAQYGRESLNRDVEVTQLQLTFNQAQGEPVNFQFLPQTSAPSLGTAVAHFAPDVVHIASHGDVGALNFADDQGRSVRMTTGLLRASLVPPPRILYLNACDSSGLADQLSESVPITIGTTAKVANDVAARVAAKFYEGLISGRTIGKSFEPARELMSALSHEKTACKIFARGDGEAWLNEPLRTAPRIVARFSNDRMTRDGKGGYFFDLIIQACPEQTRQVVFFTDDESYVPDEVEDYAEELTDVTRGTTRHDGLWISEEAWWADCNPRLYACGSSGFATLFAVTSTLGDAVRNYYRTNDPYALVPQREAIERALRVLE